MARPTLDTRLPPRNGGLVTLVVVAVLACAGCTICPDPFDYSGPVPNGSPPQNDFRARSGGILPVGAAPKPWPPVVNDAGRPDEMPVIADRDATGPDEPLVAEGDPTTLRQTSVLVRQPAADVEAAPAPVQPDDEVDLSAVPPAEAGPAPQLPPADAGSAGGETSSAAGERPIVPAAASPEPRESQGWRPRRRPAG